MLQHILILGLFLQSVVPDRPEPARQLLASAQEASDIRSVGPFLLEAKITASAAKTLEGRYRLIFESESRWRQDVVIGTDQLTQIQSGNTLYTKSTSAQVEAILLPFFRIGSYGIAELTEDPKTVWEIKDRKKEGVAFKCIRAKSRDSESEYCLLDGLYVGDSNEINYSDFREALGKRYPFSWKTKTPGVTYAGNIERIVKAKISPELFGVDGTFEAENSVSCSRPHLKAGELVTHVRPEYPPIAKASHLQGTVSIKALIDQSGNVRNAKVLSGHPMLVDSALTAVKQWHYKPTLCDGKPIPVTTTINVNYFFMR